MKRAVPTIIIGNVNQYYKNKGEVMIDAIKDKVAIIGMGCTKFGENWDKSWEDMLVDAVYEAYQDAGIDSSQIEACWIGSVMTSTAAILASPLKLDGKPVSMLRNECVTPLDCLRNACFSVACGMYDIVLVAGVEKLKDSGFGALPDRPAYCTNYGTYLDTWSGPGGFALPAARYFAKYGATKEHLAKIAVKNHRNGALSPKAHFQREVTLEQVMNAPIVAWPLGLFDCCPSTDGAAAAIITRREIAKKFRDDYIVIRGIGLAADAELHLFRANHDYLHWPSTVAAAKQAYEQAGIKDPFKEIDIVQLHDCFTITELLSYEDLGLCKKGEAKDFVDSGVFELGGELPVNTDGGLKSFGHPVGASGIRMIYETYKQMQGKAGPRQLKKIPEVGLAHNIGGAPFVAAVVILHNRI
jgi:acetyl-CoA C-acetyltransferase